MFVVWPRWLVMLRIDVRRCGQVESRNSINFLKRLAAEFLSRWSAKAYRTPDRPCAVRGSMERERCRESRSASRVVRLRLPRHKWHRSAPGIYPRYTPVGDVPLQGPFRKGKPIWSWHSGSGPVSCQPAHQRLDRPIMFHAMNDCLPLLGEGFLLFEYSILPYPFHFPFPDVVALHLALSSAVARNLATSKVWSLVPACTVKIWPRGL